VAPAELLDKWCEKHSRRGYRPAENKRPDREQHRDYQPSPPIFLEHKIVLTPIARSEDERPIVKRACLFQVLQVVEPLIDFCLSKFVPSIADLRNCT
jgi:hypothetical protein